MNQTMEMYQGIQAFHASSKNEWRNWLLQNHQSEKSIWLIIYKKESQIPSVYYSEAVDEALCFGWIDSKPNKRDENSYYQFFAKRSPKSNWSKVNKAKVSRLIEQNLMHPSGLEMIEIAQKNGTWNALDDVENQIIPLDLHQQFQKNKIAFENWENFPKSSKRLILEWIITAKKSETRQKRIDETVSQAEKNIKANHYRQ
jgi:uncharacterized protein YdeI (YjbR/CyaY-like superfamily)